MMKKLFGSGSKKKSDTNIEEDALVKLKNSKSLLHKKIDFLESKIDEQLKIAIENKTKNKRLALNALKQKKRYEEQCKNCEGLLNSVTLQIDNIESSYLTIQIAQSMQDANKVLKSTNEKVNVDKMLNIVDDMQEEYDKAQEINDALINIKNMAPAYDEDDLLNELNGLDKIEEQNIDNALSNAEFDLKELPNIPSELPNVPLQSKNIAQKQKIPLTSGNNSQSIPNYDKDVEDELNKLMDWGRH